METKSTGSSSSGGEKASVHSETTVTGLILFAIYTAFYAGFVLLNTFAPSTMAQTPIAGVNLAILYGFALIIVAFVLAMVYGWLCRVR